MTREAPRRDRTGDLEPPDAHHCDKGWLPGTRDSDHPKPCYHCKPHLRPDRRRARTHGPHGG